MSHGRGRSRTSPVQFHTCKCNFIGQDHARGSRFEDGNGIIPLNDCLPVRVAWRVFRQSVGPCAAAAPRQFCHFDSSLLSSVTTKYEVADRGSHRSLERTDEERVATCKLLLCGIERLDAEPEVILRVAQRIPNPLYFNLYFTQVLTWSSSKGENISRIARSHGGSSDNDDDVDAPPPHAHHSETMAANEHIYSHPVSPPSQPPSSCEDGSGGDSPYFRPFELCQQQTKSAQLASLPPSLRTIVSRA